MSQDGARTVALRADRRAVRVDIAVGDTRVVEADRLTIGHAVKCSQQYALRAAKRRRFPSSRAVTSLFIAPIASPMCEAAATDSFV